MMLIKVGWWPNERQSTTNNNKFIRKQWSHNRCHAFAIKLLQLLWKWWCIRAQRMRGNYFYVMWIVSTFYFFFFAFCARFVALLIKQNHSTVDIPTIKTFFLAYALFFIIFFFNSFQVHIGACSYLSSCQLFKNITNYLLVTVFFDIFFSFGMTTIQIVDDAVQQWQRRWWNYEKKTRMYIKKFLMTPLIELNI